MKLRHALTIVFGIALGVLTGGCPSDEVGSDTRDTDAADTRDAADTADTRDTTDTADTRDTLDASDVADTATETSQLDVDTVPDATPLSIGWCILQYPKSLTLAPGAASGMVYGRVFVAGVTETSTPDRDGYPVLAELGVGSGDDPESWTWTAATYVRDVGNDDELEASFVAPTIESDYHFAYRVRLLSADAGAWSYCDGDGLDDGFAVGDAGALTVAVPPADEVDYAVLRPAVASWVVGATPATFEVVVFEAGLTQGAGAGAGVAVQIGYGDPDVGFTWLDASYLRDEDGLGTLDNDVYAVALPAALAVGTYDVIANVTLDGGETRTYVDTSGTLDGYDQSLSAKATVLSAAAVDYCRIQYPTDPIALTLGGTADVYGVVYQPGVTGTAGTHALRSAAGFGPTGSTPDATWTWFEGAFHGTFDNGFGQQTNDEHKAVLNPSATGTFDWAWRFSRDDGAHWTYCNKAGSPTWDGSQAGKLLISP
ncbi:MAG: hypothetical protein JNJ59_26870 [Deltaproteobacteria bacterium]|nr:hypothetical protein [Deltaproteobacteria bacterium]